MPRMQIDLRESWWIGAVEIPTRVVLAPMAGVSVQAFRRQGRRYGAGLVCSEMVSCAGIEHRNEKTLGYLRVATDEHPLAIQIFGSEPAVMADAARMVEAAGADIVDMNFGCPVRKVTKTGAGANLLEDADLACRITEAVAGAVSVPVSVKMRRGLEDGSRVCLELGPKLADAGAAALTLHPFDQRAPSPRHDYVDVLIHSEHEPDGGAVARRHQLDGSLRQTGRVQPLAERRDQRPRRVEALRPATQNRGIAGFEREAAGIGGYVRPALVDDTDDAEWHGDPLDRKAVRTRPFGQHAADRIGQGGDRLEPGGDRLDAFGIKCQPVAQRDGHTVALGFGQVAAVGGEDLRGSSSEGRRGIVQRCDLGLSGHKAEGCGRLTGTPPHLGHDRR